MKRLIIVLVMTTIGLSSFVLLNVERPAYGNAPRSAGLQIVNALRHRSAEMYLEMFPSLKEFNGIMEKNGELYGKNLQAAEDEFAAQYMRDLKPAVNESFSKLIQDGEARGLNWSEVEFVRWEVDNKRQQHWSVVPFVLVITHREKEYKIRMDRTLILDGQIKVSQFVKLI